MLRVHMLSKRLTKLSIKMRILLSKLFDFMKLISLHILTTDARQIISVEIINFIRFDSELPVVVLGSWGIKFREFCSSYGFAFYFVIYNSQSHIIRYNTLNKEFITQFTKVQYR